MTTDTIAPPREQLSRGKWEIPHRDRKTNRVAYRRLHMFEQLHHAGRISDGCKLASDKLVKHMLGAQGVRVGSGAGLPPDDFVEYPEIYHGQKLAEIRKVVRNQRQWEALLQVAEESRTLEEIGRSWLGCKQRGQAYTAGLALVRLGLEAISQHYGLDTGFHAQDRRSACR